MFHPILESWDQSESGEICLQAWKLVMKVSGEVCMPDLYAVSQVTVSTLKHS